MAMSERARQRKSPVIGDNGVHLQEGKATEVARFIKNSIGKVEFTEPQVQEFENRLHKFLNRCIAEDLRIGNQMMYLALGLTPDNVRQWGHGETRTPEHTRFIKRVKQICTVARELYMASGQINPITGIFWQKNYDGLVDQQQMVVTPSQPLGEQLSEADTKRLLGD